MTHAKRMLQRALQESLDRRDNGGPSGLRAVVGVDDRDAGAEGEGAAYGSVQADAPPVQDSPVEVWAARQRQRTVAV